MTFCDALMIDNQTCGMKAHSTEQTGQQQDMSPTVQKIKKQIRGNERGIGKRDMF